MGGRGLSHPNHRHQRPEHQQRARERERPVRHRLGPDGEAEQQDGDLAGEVDDDRARGQPVALPLRRDVDQERLVDVVGGVVPGGVEEDDDDDRAERAAATCGVSAMPSPATTVPTRMNGRLRPSQPSQTRSDQPPTAGETSAPTNARLFPSRPSSRYESVKAASQSVSVKLLNALKTPVPKLQPR